MNRRWLLALLSLPLACSIALADGFATGDILVVGSTVTPMVLSTAFDHNNTNFQNKGTQTHTQLEQRIGALENNQSGYPQSIYSVNFSTGDSFVDVDTTTYVPGAGIYGALLSMPSTTNRGNLGYSSPFGIRQKIIPTETKIINQLSLWLGYNAIIGTYGNYVLYISSSDLSTIWTSTYPVTRLFPGSTCGEISHSLDTISLNANSTYYITLTTGPTFGSTDYGAGRGVIFYLAPLNSGNQGLAQDNSTGVWVDNPAVDLEYAFFQSSGMYSTTIATTSISNFQFWGKFFATTSEPSGSSITYRVQPRSSYGDNTQAWRQINNNDVLSYTSAYMGVDIEFSRSVSTATPIVNTAGFQINYASPLLSAAVIQQSSWTYTGTSTFTQQMNVSSITATGEITTGYGFFHDRGDIAVWDKTAVDFTVDTAWHDLDLSAIVPAGAKAILIGYQVANTLGANNPYFGFRKNGRTNTVGDYIYVNASGNYQMDTFIVACDSNRVIEYIVQNYSTWTTFQIVVKGWYK